MIEPNTQHNFFTIQFLIQLQLSIRISAMTPSIYSCRSIWLIHGVKKQANTDVNE